MNVDDYRRNRKNTSDGNLKLKRRVMSFINRILICIIILLSALIINKKNPNYSEKIQKFVYEESISFTKFKNLYNKYFGKYIGDSYKMEEVFNEELNYQNKAMYKDGVKLVTNDNYLVPALDSGIVIFMGEKEEYGYTVIVQQINGIDVWYSNINPKDIKMYDYIKKGDLIGEVKDNTLYLLFEEKGKFLDYKKYI